MGRKSTHDKDGRGSVLAAVFRRLGIVAFAALLFLVIGYGANNRLDVSKYTYESEALALSFNGYKIVHLSDLHNHTFADDNAEIIRTVKNLQPDVIVMTGDMIDGFTHININAAAHFLQQMTEIAPVYYVYGNHEHKLDKSKLEPFQAAIAEYGVNYLENETVQLESENGQTISLIGMDDNSLQANILGTLAEDAPDDFKIMLAHEPQFLETEYAPSGVDIVFCGHAHGGQWRIPFTDLGIWAPDQGFFPKYTSGEHTVDGTTEYISRGLGNSAFPLRLFNHPEIICVTLKCPGAPES